VSNDHLQAFLPQQNGGYNKTKFLCTVIFIEKITLELNISSGEMSLGVAFIIFLQIIKVGIANSLPVVPTFAK